MRKKFIRHMRDASEKIRTYVVADPVTVEASVDEAASEDEAPGKQALLPSPTVI